ncbi:SIS domain-containing protein [Solwaraspora sp. WMMD1047]|uniref:SIS domain-containing protein n=1 Tax=Solwaraspora sp. WMMD1047 TaxID=3016102 RepID=UPI0024164753|nr:SIS domain-containing protein [Solwaraspora sp. WMMD1047]MDG4829593.1 SIS domain-containing protein [Solwaraspora sp. WMMD1047]
MAEYDLAEVARQRHLLADDVRTVLAQTTPGWGAVLAGPPPRSVLVVGSGDSWAAGHAASIALADAGVLVRTETPTAVLSRRSAEFADVRLAVVVSASGGNAAAVAVAQRLRRLGLPVVAVTGDPASPLARAAEHTVGWRLAGLAPCPGVRTYQASLLTLMALVPGLAADGGAALAATVERSYGAHDELVRELLPGILDRRGSGVPVFAALGAHLGSARYAAAKVVETAGIPARAEDLEEWWHVARFAEPPGSPLIVLDLPAGAAEAGADLVARARAGGGRTVVTLTSAGAAGVPEPWWPLWHLGFGVDLGYALARHRGVRPFAAR